MTLRVEVVSPERVLWVGEAAMVTARTLPAGVLPAPAEGWSGEGASGPPRGVSGGDISFLTGRTPFVGALATGRVIVRPQDGPDELIAVHGGFIEVSSNRVTLLCDVAELASQIDVERARAAAERAEARLRLEHDAEAQAALSRARLRLDVAGAA